MISRLSSRKGCYASYYMSPVRLQMALVTLGWHAKCVTVTRVSVALLFKAKLEQNCWVWGGVDCVVRVKVILPHSKTAENYAILELCN